MEETSIPVRGLSLQRIAEDINPAIEKIETEDEKIAKLSGDDRWLSLKDRINRKIKAIDDSTRITSNTMGLVDDVQLYGFKCMAKDLLIEAYQGIIDDVEATAKILKEKNNETKSETI